MPNSGKKFSPGEGLLMKATGDEDVEGHGGPRTRVTGDDVEGHGGPRTRVTGDEDVEGHWMPDAGSSLRLAKARNSDIERDARQHRLANDARQARADHDPKRSHQKG